MNMFQSHCPECGSDDLITITPSLAGPDGWGQRCGACAWMATLATPSPGEIYREAGMTPREIADQLTWEAAIARGEDPDGGAQS